MEDLNALIEDIKNKDDKAFDELVLMYMKKAYSVAFRFMRNDGDAQDMVQEAFLKVYINIGSYNKKYNFSSWFYRILINCCINALKKRSRRRFLLDSWEKDKTLEIEKLEIGKDNSIRDPEEDLIRKEKNKIIMDGVYALPEKQRDILMLYDIEGFSQNEISDILNIPLGSVMSRLFYGRKRLKKYLKKVLKEI